jgi:hypothetical protein
MPETKISRVLPEPQARGQIPQGSAKVELGEVTQEQEAPEGPPVSGPSADGFQPAENIAMRIMPTRQPTG